MSAEDLLSRLHGVRKSGNGYWSARCPAHEDRIASLSVREVDDGRVLIHCFAGCSVEQVLAGAGLDWDAVFPERPIADRKAPIRQPFLGAQVVRAVGFEALLVAAAAANIAFHVELSKEDRERLILASERIIAAVQEAGYGD